MNLEINGFEELNKEESIKLSLEKVPDVDKAVFINLKGYIDTYNTNAFRLMVEKVIEAGYINLVFRAENLSYVSSTGIGAFTSFLKAVKRNDGNILLSNLLPNVLEVFKLLGFTSFFTITDTAEDAVTYLLKDNTKEIFPKIFSCPICSKKLRASKDGRYRCPQCKTILAVATDGTIYLG